MSHTSIRIHKLHPTQITIGLTALGERVKHLSHMTKDELHTHIRDHHVPVVSWPEWRYYIIDHHHLCRALRDIAVEEAEFVIVDDLSSIVWPSEFWSLMESKKFVHPFWPNGEKRDLIDIPQDIMNLKNDPYRSLATFLRERSVYSKDQTPYIEFQWADAFRWAIAADLIESDHPKAIEQAMLLINTYPDRYKSLPGYITTSSSVT